jgi:hypothetical protein
MIRTMPDLATDFDASEVEHIANQLGLDARRQLSAVYERQMTAFCGPPHRSKSMMGQVPFDLWAGEHSEWRNGPLNCARGLGS